MNNFVVLAAILVTTILAGCQSPASKSSPQGQAKAQTEITVAMENDYNLDPIKCKDVTGIQVIGQIFEGLMGLD